MHRHNIGHRESGAGGVGWIILKTALFVVELVHVGKRDAKRMRTTAVHRGRIPVRGHIRELFEQSMHLGIRPHKCVVLGVGHGHKVSRESQPGRPGGGELCGAHASADTRTHTSTDNGRANTPTHTPTHRHAHSDPDLRQDL